LRISQIKIISDLTIFATWFFYDIASILCPASRTLTRNVVVSRVGPECRHGTAGCMWQIMETSLWMPQCYLSQMLSLLTPRCG